MNYELAKELKDAGFVLRRTDYAHTSDGELGECAYCGQHAFIVGNEHYIIPTLSELIAACGKFFAMQELESGQWEAQRFGKATPSVSSTGRTPEEAVARLYLALNKK